VISCQEKASVQKKGHINTFMTIDPGHFHAYLVHKKMYSSVDSSMYVYAPKGKEVDNFNQQIGLYNTRKDNPTGWKTNVYTGDDFLSKAIAAQKGNVMILAGKNAQKSEYIAAAVNAGIHVFSDKPMVVNPDGFKQLKTAFETAKDKNVLIYDIMTERFEITTALQKEFSMNSDLFGSLVKGTLENPAISKESVHHFYKTVSGRTLVRPLWYFDTDQLGEGIVDVTTHLVDLIQWEAFPDQSIDTTDIVMLSAKRWPTILSEEQYKNVTQSSGIPEFLNKDMSMGNLYVFSNGEMNYTLNGIHAKVSVIWNYEAPKGTGDTHYSSMRGTNSDLIIKQGDEEGYKPTLYIKPHVQENFESILNAVITSDIVEKWPGVSYKRINEDLFEITVPEKYNVGHEAHFGQVTENFLEYLEAGYLPEWETPNMIAKYYTIMEAYKMAIESTPSDIDYHL
jgi:predicted dehydrogenase